MLGTREIASLAQQLLTHLGSYIVFVEQKNHIKHFISYEIIATAHPRRYEIQVHLRH